MSLLAAEDLTVRFGGQTVLHGVSLSVERQEVVTIVGPNGSGKSTLLRTLIGAIQPDTGRVTKAAGLRVGYVPQRLALDPTLPLTVSRFLSLPTRSNGDATRAALDRVGAAGLEPRQMTALSGGQFQRVLLARALLNHPDILILDEPAQSLDQMGIAALYGTIDDLRRDLGCAVLMVSHDLVVVMRASDRVICLNGHICCQGSPIAVSGAPEYRALFGAQTAAALALYEHHHDHSHHDHDGAGHRRAESTDAG
ncbi:MAG: metal ABC transporter ATP-binding protein [Pseudomonadota bacterium]